MRGGKFQPQVPSSRRIASRVTQSLGAMAGLMCREGFLQSCLWASAFVFLLSSAFVSSLSSDGIALLAFKASLNESSVEDLSDWIESSEAPCDWTGIICSGGFVTEIKLDGRNISGLLADSLGDIKTLQNISLGNNLFWGPIPPSIFNLSQLRHVDLGFNNLNGTIPFGFQNLVNLEHLDLTTNSLIGGIPEDFANQSVIGYLDMSANPLGGPIPSGIASLTNLTFLNMNTCGLTGTMPANVGNLKQLQYLYLQMNLLDGPLPTSFGGLDSLVLVDLSNNQFTILPPEIGDLRSIQVLRLQNNNFFSPIPSELGNLSKTLLNLDLAYNYFFGSIPDQLGSLSLLLLLHLDDNNLTGNFPPGIAELPVLEDLTMYDNFLTGELPSNLGQNQPLIKFDVTNNSFTGPIPRYLCNMGKLQRLILSQNSFYGPIPDSLGSCPTLFRLRLDYNRLNGSIPPALGNSQSLNYTDFSFNNLTGTIPAELGNCSALTYVSVTGNQLSGRLPAELGNLGVLGEFAAANNSLEGSMPVQLCSTPVANMDLSFNEFSGQIPLNISNCDKYLTQLFLNNNKFSGTIPATFANMSALHVLNLSHNALVGPIPQEFGSSQLQTLDVSYNNLSGPMTLVGFLATLAASDYEGNPGLCVVGSNQVEGLPSCGTFLSGPDKGKGNRDKLRLILWILIGILLPLLASVGICCWCYYSERFRRKIYAQKHGLDWSITMFHKVPDLTLKDILDSLTEDNVVGSGGSGKVYKGEIRAGKVFRGRTRTTDQLFVVKKLKRSVGRYDQGFKAEVETLSSIRHNNVVKLLACCAARDDGTKLLVYEFMPNGSLADQLHGVKGGMLKWETRLKIAVGAAQCLSYLHHDCVPPILHRDVKTSNILLEENFNPRLADFGLAKLLQGIQNMQTMSHIVGSHGYIAPELAFSLRANEKSDVYSYGVVLLELVTGRRAVVESDDGEDVVTWTQGKIREKQGLVGALDKRVGHIREDTQEEMLMVLRIGLFCTNVSPADRPCMRGVVRMLLDVKASSSMGCKSMAASKARTISSEQLLPELSVPLHPPVLFDLIQVSP